MEKERRKIDQLLKFYKTFLVDPCMLILPINQINLSRRYTAKAVRLARAERDLRP